MSNEPAVIETLTPAIYDKPLRQCGDLCLYEKDGLFKITSRAGGTLWMTNKERKQIAKMLTNPYPIQDGD